MNKCNFRVIHDNAKWDGVTNEYLVEHELQIVYSRKGKKKRKKEKKKKKVEVHLAKQTRVGLESIYYQPRRIPLDTIFF